MSTRKIHSVQINTKSTTFPFGILLHSSSSHPFHARGITCFDRYDSALHPPQAYLVIGGSELYHSVGPLATIGKAMRE